MPQATLRLQVADNSGLNASAVERIAFSGLDQIPTPCRSRLRDQELAVEHNSNDSGRLHVPYTLAGRGEFVFTTGTLMHRERPYQLEIELARGKINQLRNQVADWIGLGLVLPAAVEKAVTTAVDSFGAAATRAQSDPPAAIVKARETLALALDASEALINTYIDQAITLRRKQSSPLPTALSVKLPQRPLTNEVLSEIHTAFNALTVPMTWRQIEAREGQFDWSATDALVDWCTQHHVPVIGGPLLNLEMASFPDWVRLWSGDVDGFVNLALEHASNVVKRYRGRVALWNVAGRVNSSNVLGLHEEYRLQLAVRLVETVRSIDPQIPSVLRFDQPFGEYMRLPGHEMDLSPLHFAEALVRVGVQFNGVSVELNAGYGPSGTSSRDRLDLSRMLDQWSYLGLPVHVSLTAPSAQTLDPRARLKIVPTAQGQPWSPQVQSEWVMQIMPLLLSKAYVHSITWNQLYDADPHEFPHGGLYDEAGQAKPALTDLKQLRKKQLH